ncbi:MAG: O-antigen ligase family protein [Candidatus Omnitrophica bacterium]|nr:O-antigen ligase family protein [Candidatus Omnitrophota bacterium]
MKEKLFRIFDYGSEYSLYGMILFMPISNAGIESFFGFAFLFFLLKKALKPDFGFLRSTACLFLLFFIFFLSLSLFNSGPYLQKSLSSLFFKWAEYILIFVITQDTLRSAKRIRNSLIILLVIAAVVGIDGLFQRFIGVDFLRHKKIISLWGETMLHGIGITGPFQHYNSFGTYLMFNLSLLLVLLISIKDKIYKISLFMLFVLLQACFILTFSRGSWLGFLCGVFLLLLLYRKVNKLVLIFTIYIILIIFFPGSKGRSMLVDADRFTVWKGAFGMIKDHPFLGMGLGTFMDYFQEYVSKDMYLRYTHNCYLQIWAESGIFALVSFILFCGSVMYKGIKAFKNNNSNFVLLGFICAFFGFLVQIFFDSQLYSLQLSALFWFIAGFIMALARLRENAPLITK